jgi:hypothetical protein
LSPGIGYVNAHAVCKGGCIPEYTEPHWGFAPLISGVIGCNYYVGSIFNFFVKARFVGGHFKGDVPEFQQLNEIKLTAGLGWNLRVWKPK